MYYTVFFESTIINQRVYVHCPLCYMDNAKDLEPHPLFQVLKWIVQKATPYLF